MTDEKNPLGLKKIHHVEFYVGNAKQAEFYYRKAFGFSRALIRVGNGQPRNDFVCCGRTASISF
jgi:catechol-2,3-dioxygenase